MANQLTASGLFIILCAGVIPPLFWLWFWLKEDKKRPAPRRLLVLSFFFGAAAVIFVLPLQAWAQVLLRPGFGLLFAWALIEEFAKLGVAYLVDFRNKVYKHPIDYMIYLLTVALGFAAFENVLFLTKSYASGGLHASMLTASMRFLGASLLHVGSSSILGGVMAMAFCKSPRSKLLYAFLGLGLATILHTLFNFFIINLDLQSNGGNILIVFAFLWISMLGLLIFFEKVKTVTCKLKTI